MIFFIATCTKTSTIANDNHDNFRISSELLFHAQTNRESFISTRKRVSAIDTASNGNSKDLALFFIIRQTIGIMQSHGIIASVIELQTLVGFWGLP